MALAEAASDPAAPVVVLGEPGASAERTYHRLRRRAEAAARLGGTKAHAAQKLERYADAFRVGAIGEREVAARIVEGCAGEPVALVADRKMPYSGGNIDLIAIGPSGLTVVDVKHYAGRIEARAIASATNGQPTERLRIAGRERRRLIEGVWAQHAVVTEALVRAGSPVPVEPVLCFHKGDLRTLSVPRVDGVALLSPRQLANRSRQRGFLTPATVRNLAELLAGELPPG